MILSKWHPRPALLGMAAAVALLAGCEREPDELLFIVGRVTDEGGQPLPAVPVTLDRNGQAACDDRWFALGGPEPELDRGEFVPFAQLESNPRGDFLFELAFREVRADDLGSQWSLACFEARAGNAWGVSRLTLRHTRGDIELPDLPLLGSSATFREESGVLHAEPPSKLELSGYRHADSAWELSTDAGLVWFTPQAAAHGAQVLDAPVWEDFSPLHARHRTMGLYAGPSPFLTNQGSLGVTLSVETTPTALALPPAVPVSRGAACAHRARDAAPGTCSLTDGDPTLVGWGNYLDGEEWVPPPGTLEVALDGPRPVRRLIVRDLVFTRPAGALFVEGSVDGVDWQRMGELGAFPYPEEEEAWYADSLRNRRAPGLYADVPLSPSGPVKFLRLQGALGEYPGGQGPPPGDFQFLGARELSVFE